MNIIDTIKESAIKQIVSGIFGILLLLIGLIYPDIIPGIFRYIIQNLSKEALLKITSLAILLSILLAGLSFTIYLKYKPRLTAKCGVLWDKNKEAHCPACKSPLSESTFYNAPANMHHFYKCINCDKEITLKHNGKNILLDEALKLLNS